MSFLKKLFGLEEKKPVPKPRKRKTQKPDLLTGQPPDANWTGTCAEFHKRNARDEAHYRFSRERAMSDVKEALTIGMEEFTWRTAGDQRVCPRCAAHNGKKFRYDSPPQGGFPGYADGCRCIAEVVMDMKKLKYV